MRMKHGVDGFTRQQRTTSCSAARRLRLQPRRWELPDGGADQLIINLSARYLVLFSIIETAGLLLEV